ncbi:MAG: DUF2975 domain-containing protein [Hyphomicrobiaceae bacterium]
MSISSATAPRAQSQSTNLQCLAATMCFVTAIGGALAELVLAWVWFWPSTVETLVVPHLGLPIASVSLDGTTRLMGFLASMVPLGVLLYALHQAYQLFDRYRLGEVFSPEAPVRLRRIGFCMIALGVLRPLTNTALGLILTAHALPGQRILAIAISLDDYMIAAFGGLVLAIGHVMVAAASMADEHSKII